MLLKIIFSGKLKLLMNIESSLPSIDDIWTIDVARNLSYIISNRIERIKNLMINDNQYSRIYIFTGLINSPKDFDCTPIEIISTYNTLRMFRIICIFLNLC